MAGYGSFQSGKDHDARQKQGSRLRALRLERRWSQQDLAKALWRLTALGDDPCQVTSTTVSRWERGLHRPDWWSQVCLCRLFEVPGEEFGFRVCPAEPTYMAFEQEPLAKTLADWHAGAQQLVADMPEVEAGAFSIEPTEEPLVVNPKTLVALSTMTATLRRLADTVGTVAAVGLVLRHLNLMARIFQVPQPDALLPRLCATLSDLTQLFGQLAFDRDDHFDAWWGTQTALLASRVAGDWSLYAYLHGIMGTLLLAEGHPDDALKVIAAGHNLVEQGRLGPRTQGHLHAIEAEVHACKSDGPATDASLRQAAIAIDSAGPVNDDPPWLHHVNTAGFLACLGHCSVLLERPAAAQTTLWEALAMLDPLLAGRRSAVLTDLAVTFIQQGEIDVGCRLAGECLELVTAVGSLRGIRSIRKLRERLEPWAGTPTVTELDERLLLLSAFT